MGDAGPTVGGNGTDGRKGRPAAHPVRGRARGLAAGEFFKPRGPRKVDPAALKRRRGRLGKVPFYGRSELGKYFGIVVREEMKSQGYRQWELALVANVSPGAMSSLLNARHSVLMHIAERVADALGFEVEVLKATGADLTGDVLDALGFKVEVLKARARRLMEAEQQRDPARQSAQVQAVRAAADAALKKCKTLNVSCARDPLSSRPCHRNRHR